MHHRVRQSKLITGQIKHSFESNQLSIFRFADCQSALPLVCISNRTLLDSLAVTFTSDGDLHGITRRNNATPVTRAMNIVQRLACIEETIHIYVCGTDKNS